MEDPWRCAVKAAYAPLSLVIVVLTVLGCGKKLPDSYGIYADTNHGQLLLPGQKVKRVGDFLASASGLDGPSGAECRSLKDFIVYGKDASPDSIHLVRLEFARDATVPVIFGASVQTRANLWLPNRHIDVEVRPVEARPDMYIVAPRTPLDKGFYALYMESAGGGLGTDGRVYDIAIGSINDFPSSSMTAKAQEEEIKANTNSLLGKLNQITEQNDYRHLDDVYRPHGQILSGSELQKYVDGNQVWLNSAGKVLSSEITGVSLVREDRAEVVVKTLYAKLGFRQEVVAIEKIDGRYFIAEIK
jgi:hypothetical protein